MSRWGYVPSPYLYLSKYRHTYHCHILVSRITNLSYLRLWRFILDDGCLLHQKKLACLLTCIIKILFFTHIKKELGSLIPAYIFMYIRRFLGLCSDFRIFKTELPKRWDHINLVKIRSMVCKVSEVYFSFIAFKSHEYNFLSNNILY